LPLLGMSAGEAHAHVKRSPIQNLVFAAARSADRLRNAPYEFEPDFAVSKASTSRLQARVAPKAALLSAGSDDPTLVPLDEAVEQAWKRSYLSHRSARFALPRAVAPPISSYSTSVSYMERQQRTMYDQLSSKALFGLSPRDREDPKAVAALELVLPGLPLDGLVGRSSLQQLPRANMSMPDINRLIFDSAKLARLDALLRELKAGGHRVLIFFQMTRMIDLLEEYLVYRSYRYLRLDGSSKIEDRRDMVTSWQSECVLVLALSYFALIDRY
jgi:DNA helicase INO80